MKLLRTIKTELRRAFGSYQLYIALLLPFLIYVGSGIDELIQLWNHRHTDILHFTVFLMETGSFSTMLILSACFPFSSAYCDDIRHQYIRLMLPRCGEKNYCTAKIITGALTGGMAAATGLILFILFLSVRFPLVIKGGGMFDSFIMGKATNYGGELLEAGRYISFYVTMVYNSFLFGALWGAAGITVSGLIPNPFVAMFTPFLLNRVIVMFRIPHSMKPETLLNGSFNMGGWAGSLFYATIYTIALIGCFWLLFKIFAQRRLQRV
jgi:hypothetical protein